MKTECQKQGSGSKRSDRRIKSRAGASLVEVMVALSLFGTFTLGTCKVLSSHRRLLDMARDHYTAANMAKDRLELARTLEFDQIPELAEDPITVDESGLPDQYGHYLRTTTVTQLNTNIYKLAISVGIQNRRTLEFAPAEQVINTYIAKHL